MVQVAIALEQAGLDIPLLIGGATTSQLHTALKIAPVYHAPVVHLKDASQNPTIAARLMNPTLKQELEKDLKKEYEHLREEVREKQPELLSLEEARKKKMQLF
jgi:5-methyltetrahydrofolate--homocysteine methyltransferase